MNYNVLRYFSVLADRKSVFSQLIVEYLLQSCELLISTNHVFDS